MSVKPSYFRVIFKFSVSSLISWLVDLLITESGVLKFPTIILELYFSLQFCFCFIYVRTL